MADFRFPPRFPLAEPVKEASQEDMDPFKQEAEEAQQLVEPTQKRTPSVDAEAEERPQADEQREAISRRVAECVEAVRHHPAPLPAEQPSWLWRLIFIAIFSIIAYHVHGYKVQSAAIGFCDVGTRTSRAVEEAKARYLLLEECNRENRTTLHSPSAVTDWQDSTACPLPPLLPIPQPKYCTPCPDHASCSQFSVTCDTGYLLHPNPLVFFLPTPPSASNTSLATANTPSDFVWGVLSDTFNGLPGFGSVALPPRCLEDPNRKKTISVLGRAIEARLGKERGRRVCAGGKGAQEHVKDSDGGEAKKWGVEISKLKETMRKGTPVRHL
jgi:hypothetical protein